MCLYAPLPQFRNHGCATGRSVCITPLLFLLRGTPSLGVCKKNTNSKRHLAWNIYINTGCMMAMIKEYLLLMIKKLRKFYFLNLRDQRSVYKLYIQSQQISFYSNGCFGTKLSNGKNCAEFQFAPWPVAPDRWNPPDFGMTAADWHLVATSVKRIKTVIPKWKKAHSKSIYKWIVLILSEVFMSKAQLRCCCHLYLAGLSRIYMQKIGLRNANQFQFLSK